MKAQLVASLITTCLLGIKSNAAPPVEAALTFASSSYDLGVFNAGAVAESISLELQNAGPEPVEIAEIKASCGCIRLVEYPHSIGAKTSGAVTATFTGKTALGRFSVQVVAAGVHPGQIAGTSLMGWLLPANGVLIGSEVVDFGRSYVEEYKVRSLRVVTRKSVAKVEATCTPGFLIKKNSPLSEKEVGRSVNAFEFLIEKKAGHCENGEVIITADGEKTSVPIRLAVDKPEPLLPSTLYVDALQPDSPWAHFLIKKGARFNDVPKGIEITRVGEQSPVYEEFRVSAHSKERGAISESKIPVSWPGGPEVKVITIVVRN